MMMNDSPNQSASPDAPRDRSVRVIVLGSTGSIGVNTLAVIEHLNALPDAPRRFEVVGLAAGSNVERLAEQARRFNVAHLALSEAGETAPDSPWSHTGPDAARRLVEEVECDLVVAAIVGAAGLPAVVEAVRRGRTIALANKETLVAAGEFIMPLARRHHAPMLPVDSEHSAIFQCLQSRTDHHEPASDAIDRIILTASGGPFRTWPAERIREATLQQALNHPTWDMGAKVTIDSASLSNKALEMIEAHHLFGFGNERIDVLVHPQSIVHGFVEFKDGSVLAQLGPPDMRTPIQYALTYPERPGGCNHRLNWSELSRLEFEPPDVERFPAINLARRVIDAGGSSGAIFNAANEEAVKAFMAGRIPFGSITAVAERVLETADVRPIESLEDAMSADLEAREQAGAVIRTVAAATAAARA